MRTLLIALLLLAPLAAQEAKAPALSEVQRLKVQVSLRDLRIAQLQAQAAQDAFERARGDTEALIKTLAVEGWQLDLQKLEYVAVPKPEK